MVLVDSTVWIDLLRNRDSAPVVRLRALLAAGEAAVAPVIVQELLQAAAHVAAGALYARCRWAGITPRRPHDCLIAQMAVEQGVALLHDDKDFEAIASVEPRLALLDGGP